MKQMRRYTTSIYEWEVYATNKRAQKDLGRSPEEKVKGHSGAVYRGLQVHNLNNFGRGTLDNVLYQMW